MPPHQRDQLASQYFKKSVQLIASARLTGFPSPSATDPPVKVDRWFNLEGPNTKHFDVELAEYKQLSLNHPQAVSAALSSRRDAAVAATTGRVPAFMLEIVLDASFSSKDDVLVLEGKDGVKGRVATPGGDDGPRRIVIERWRIGLDPARSHMANQNIPLSTTYKNLIPFFRSLYAIIRLLPAHDLRRRIGSGRQPTSSLRLTAVASSEGSLYGLPEGFVPLNAPTGAQGVPEETVRTWKSEGVDHEFGVFSIECAYRPNVAFHLESKDSMSASSVLIEEQYFVPTMARHRRLSRESQSRPTTPSSSLPRRSGLVSQTSLESPGLSSPVETQERPKLATMSSRQMIESLSGLHGHGRSASVLERRGSEEGLAGASSMSRRESSEGAEPRGIPIGSPKPMSAYDDEQTRFTPSPSGQAGSLPRRTTLPHPQTFRHGSLASSPGLSPSASLRHLVSLSSSNSPSTPSFMQHHPVRRSSLSQGHISPSFSSSSRPPINIPHRPGSDYLPLPDSMPGDVPTPAQESSSSSRNIPVPSSSTSPTVPAPPSMTKRYSSSFGHRQGRSFSTLDGSASGSPGSRPSLSGFARASSGAGSLSRQSFMSVSKVSIEDDAEINEFLQMIDSRPTLSAPFGLGSSAFLPSTGGKSSPAIGAGGASPSSVTRPVTTKSQLSEALKRMAGSYTGNLPGVSSSSSATSSPLPPLSSSPGGFLRREPSSSSGGGGLTPSSTSSSPESGPLMPLKRGSLGANNSTSPIAPSPLRSSTEPRPLASFAKSSLSAQSSGPQSLSSGADVIGHRATSQPQSFAKFSVPTSSFSLGAIASSLPADKSKLRERRAGPVLMRGGFTITSNTSTSSPGDKDSGSSTSGEGGGHARSLSERGRTFSDGAPSSSFISTDSFGRSRQTSPHPPSPRSSRTGDVASSSPRFLLSSLVSPQTTMMNLTASGQSSVTVTGGGFELSRSPSSNLSRASPSPTPGHSTTPLDSPRAQHHVGHQPHPRATAVPLPLSDEDKNGGCDDDDILGRFELDPVGEEDEASASSRLASATLPVVLPPALPASGLAATRPEYVRNRGSSARGISSGGGGRGSAADIGAVMGRGGWAFGRS